MRKLFRFLLKEKVLLVAILIVGFIVRLYKINSPIADWHSFRQADTAAVARVYLEKGINLLEPTYYDISRVQSGHFNPIGYRFVEFPIYQLLHVEFYRVLPLFSFEEIGRTLSAVFAVVTAYFLFQIAKLIFGKYIGLLTAFIYLILPFNIYFTRVILPEPLSVMLGVVALWFFLRYEKSNRLSFLVLYSICMSAALLVKPYLVFYNFYPLYFFLKKYRLKKLFLNRETLIVSIIVLVPFILWRIWISRHPEGIPFWNWTFNGDGVRFKPAFWYWIFGERIGKLILGIWGIYPFLLGLAKVRKNAFVVSMLVGSLTYLCVVSTANVRHDYYQTLIIPSIAPVVAIGFGEMINSAKKKLTELGFPLVIFLLMILISAFQVKEYYKIDHPEIIEAGEAVQQLTPPDALVIASYNGDTAFLYQTNRKGWPVVELPIDELINEGASYYASVNLNDAQTIEFMKRFQILKRTNNYVVLKLK